MLAQRFGVALPGDGAERRRSAPTPRERETLLKVHEIAAAWFREQLAVDRRARASAGRLADRGVTDATTIDAARPRLRAGRARRPEGARCSSRASRRACCCRAGLVVQRDDGEVIDRFRNRLMMPICRDTGSVIAFGGRADGCRPAARST